MATTPFSLALGLLGLVGGFAPSAWPAALNIVLLVLTTAFGMVLVTCLIEVRPFLVPARPIAEQGMESHEPYQDSKALIISSRCSILHHGAPVTLEIRQSGYEREIGYGSIVKIQADGKAVLAVDRWCGGVDPKITEGILHNSKDVMSRLIIRLDFRRYVPQQGGVPVPPTVSGSNDGCA